MEDKLAAAILEISKVHDKRGQEIVSALDSISRQLQRLGNGGAIDNGMGAIEFLAVQLREGLGSVSSAVSTLEDSIKK